MQTKASNNISPHVCEHSPLDACRLCRIAVEHVGVRLDGEALLEDISLHIHCGELTVLMGPNGGGKTTLVRALLGQINHQGQILHQDAQGRPFPGVRMGYVPQQLPFDRRIPVSVSDLLACAFSRRPVAVGLGHKTRRQVTEALALSKAEGLAKRRLGALSGGELQRVLLALALSPVPDLLILDEPISGVDQNGQALFLETVSALRSAHHLAVLMVSHDWALVRRYADHAILLNRQVLEDGTPQQVFASPSFALAFPATSAVGGAV